MKNWSDFKSLYEGELATRQAFAECCFDLLVKHYPDKTIEAAKDSSESSLHLLSEDEQAKERVLYLTKFFLDELSNSRKGQVRKAFSDSILTHNPEKSPVHAWILCLAMIPNESELSWFNTWKQKMEEQYNVPIMLFHGDLIIENLQKYEIFDKWFEKRNAAYTPEDIPLEIVTNENETTEENQGLEENTGSIEISENNEETNMNNQPVMEIVDYEEISGLIESIRYDITNNEIENKEEKVAEPEEIKNTKNTEQLIETPVTKPEAIIETDNTETVKEETKEPVKEEIQNISENNISAIIPESENNEQEEITGGKEKDDDLQPIVFQGFQKLKEEYTFLYEQSLNLLPEQKEELEKRRKKYKDDDIRFNVEILQIEKFAYSDLLYKARLNRINENFEKSLHIYETITQNTEINEQDTEEIEKGKQLAEKNIMLNNKIFEGDFYFVQKEYMKALEAYETALKTDNKNEDVYLRYNECFGEALIQQKNYSEAINKLQVVYNADTKNEEVKQRLHFAQCMTKAKKVYNKYPMAYLNPILAPYYYNKAKSIDNTNTDVKEKLSKSTKNILLGFGAVAALVLIVFGVILLIKNIPSGSDEPVYGVKNKSIYELQMERGNYYYNHITTETVHYYDSAIIAYKRAIRYKPYDSAAIAMYNEAKEAKEAYRQVVQRNILRDSSSYFLSMRDPSEGYRLFKYMYEPGNKKKGKFGYVDENMNVVIPPVFDFNHKKMYKRGESFKNGKALALIVTPEGDSIYFYIDRYGNKISR